MAIGISVHVGVNKAQDNFDVRDLSGCRRDAEKMFEIADTQGFQAKQPLIDGEATFEAVRNAILEAAEVLEAGDIFLFTFAGHGSFNGTADDEEDFQDEIMLLHDCLLPDNYLRRKLWSKFKQGVRILGIADCCHSGTVLMSAPVGLGAGIGALSSLGGASGAAVNARVRSRTRPRWTQTREKDRDLNRGITAKQRAGVRKGNPELHKMMDEEMLSIEGDQLKARLLTLAACKDNEFAKDGEVNGAFTARLLEVWNSGEFSNYKDFMEEIGKTFNGPDSLQHPTIQTGDADEEFINQKPFTIAAGPDDLSAD